jgi:hypothetical protein
VTRLLTGAGVLALVGLLIWLYGSARYDAGRLAERAAWQARTAQATLDDLAVKARIDAARATATQESSDDLKAQLADALARAAAHSTRLRDATPRDRDLADLPRPAEPAGVADGAGQAAVLAEGWGASGQQAIVDDAVCAENTVKAQGWQDWWRVVPAGGE